ncbi:MAG: exodeoxyribonuclease VII small subunit [Acidobacteria bacterium 13_1_40CM_4_69_4]|nr:MAG: exodeoxyribonuclease VII small subunit [Acidobacteria bacterium 13_1_40CM_4_69_4]
MAIPRKGPRQPGFEAALARLETIVKSLEGGDLALEESLRLFEEGVSLTRLCAGKLEEAQRRIDVLTRGEQGDLKLVAFEGTTDDEGGGPESS